MTGYKREIAKYKKLKDFIECACDDYCESLTDQEYQWLVEGLNERLTNYLKDRIDMGL